MAGSLTESPQVAGRGRAQRVSSHMTMTTSTRITSTRVTRDFGNVAIPAARVRGARPVAAAGCPARGRRRAAPPDRGPAPAPRASRQWSAGQNPGRRARVRRRPTSRGNPSPVQRMRGPAPEPTCQNGRVPAPGEQTQQSTTCLIAGGGPAGMVLGLLLARGGVPVVVMEKHADFLRDFRGDTVHASTLRLLDELGLAAQFQQVPHRVIDSIHMQLQGVPIQITLRRLPGAHKHIALVPQWDFLELLATAAEEEPTFTLMRRSEVLGPLLRDGRVVGVRYRSVDGETREMHATLTVACDGRSSTLRTSMGLTPRSFGAPMDVWWFRLPRRSGDSSGLNGVFQSGHGCVVIDRGDYYQIAYISPKGA